MKSSTLVLCDERALAGDGGDISADIDIGGPQFSTILGTMATTRAKPSSAPPPVMLRSSSVARLSFTIHHSCVEHGIPLFANQVNPGTQ